MRPTIAEINLNNLKHNYLQLKKRAGGAGVIAVVKADAYGHGMIKCAEALEELGQDAPLYYGVALLEEAIELREKSFVTRPVLSFAPFVKEMTENYINYNIIPTITSEHEINSMQDYTGAPVKVHVNVDTGMGRVGLRHDEAVELIVKLAAMPGLILDGVYTHFATSDEADKTYANLQLERFKNVVAALRQKLGDSFKAHCANSGAILDMVPEASFDLVRPGISLYGYFPSNETSKDIDLKPVLSLITKVSTVRKIKKGESVSYGRKFTATEDINTATIPVGYADGVLRNLGGKIKVIINKNLYEQIGRITMDRIIVNLGGEVIEPGSKVILLGSEGGHTITAQDWADVQDTIPYEVTCNISKRVPREYIS